MHSDDEEEEEDAEEEEAAKTNGGSTARTAAQANVIIHTNWLACSCIYISRVLQRVEIQEYKLEAEKLVQVFEKLDASTKSDSRLQTMLKTVRSEFGANKHGTGAVQKTINRLEKTLGQFKRFIVRAHEGEDALDRLPSDKAAKRNMLSKKTMFRMK